MDKVRIGVIGVGQLHVADIRSVLPRQCGHTFEVVPDFAPEAALEESAWDPQSDSIEPPTRQRPEIGDLDGETC